MFNIKSIFLTLCMVSSAALLSLNEEDLAKMSLRELTDVAIKQQKEEVEIGIKLVNLQRTTIELTYEFLNAQKKCESESIQLSFALYPNQSCDQMQSLASQLNLQNIIQKREYIKLKYSKLDAKLIETYIRPNA